MRRAAALLAMSVAASCSRAAPVLDFDLVSDEAPSVRVIATAAAAPAPPPPPSPQIDRALALPLPRAPEPSVEPDPVDDTVAYDAGPRASPGIAIDGGAHALADDGLSLHAPLASLTRARGYGALLDVGAPDGVTLALVVQPVRAIDLSAGMSYNAISYGIRGGVTWTPLRRIVSPTLSIDVGHYLAGDANPLARLITGNPKFSSGILDRVGYDYVDAHVGFAVQRRSVTFFVRAGASWVNGQIHLGSLASNSMAMLTGDPSVTLMTLSAKLGLIYYFAR